MGMGIIMARHVEGTKETVDYGEISNLLIYDNVQYEDYATHWHHALEIIMPLQNDFIVECSGQDYRLKVGHILIIAPGTLHHLPPCRGERLILLLDPDVFPNIPKFGSILSLIQPSLLITEDVNSEIYERCHALLLHSMNAYFGIEPFKELDIFSDLLKFISLIGRTFTTQNTRFNNTPETKQQEYIEKFIDLCEYINAHCAEDLSLERAAEYIGFSKYHFGRLFKDFTGNTFYKYLNHCRISRAESLLLNPEINITEVAMGCGFNSISSFIRMFKIVKGCTPTDFRKLKDSANTPPTSYS